MYYTNRQGRLSLSSPNLKSIWYLQKQISKSNLRSTHFTKMRETEAWEKQLKVMDCIRENSFENSRVSNSNIKWDSHGDAEKKFPFVFKHLTAS